MLYRSLKRGASASLSKNSFYQATKPTTFSNLRVASMSFKTNPSLNKPAGASSQYQDQMYQQWRLNPASVDESWSKHFEGGNQVGGTDISSILQALQGGAMSQGGDVTMAQADGQKLLQYIRAFMTHGHLKADIDPLKLAEVGEQVIADKYKKTGSQGLLNIEHYGFTQQDLDKKFFVDLPGWGGLMSKKPEWTLREIRDVFEEAYCGKIGVEYMHIPDREQCNWIRDKIELRQYEQLTRQEKLVLLDRLFWTDEFSNFIGTKFNTMKRFGLEGCESFIAGMKSSMDSIVTTGAQKAVIGMPHRGRLNILANVVRKPMEQLFAEFIGTVPIEDKDANWQSHTGDAKYHLGTNYTRTYPDGKQLTVEVLANPSHLECINPVVMGRCRAENHSREVRQDTKDRDVIVPFLIHGDAAFAGQGVVYESMQMQDLKNYSVGGTIHVIVNNQIGFTTVPSKGRSGMYSSDLAKSINAPIFHVNADSAEDVNYVFRIAAEYRQKYNHDVVIDLIGYRKFGHNELDQPSFTQPMMYKRIAEMTPVARIYEQELLDNGTVDHATIERMKKRIVESLEEAYVKSKTHEFKAEDWITDQWEAIQGNNIETAIKTGMEINALKDVGNKITILPEDKTFHRLIRKIFEQRTASIQTGKGIDWGTAEALAFATLVQEGYHVRISGQDVERGTFSHRHAHVFYQDEDGYYNPINQVISDEDQKKGIRKFIASNSHLSEFAVMGYELGYAQTHPNTLTLWEAQFGDFANGAQVIIDQFLVSGEAKWNVKNGLVLLLPHGYDGQGPEHSSCRTERYLLLCNQDEFVPSDGKYDHYQIMKETNMQVVQPSSAANYFHLLRTQMRLPFRKPLVVVAPKKLLRYKGACSEIEEFGPNSHWKPLIEDQNKTLVAPEKVRKVILCSGQVYFDLEAARAKDGKNDVAILRCESLCPFPFQEIISELKKYKNAEITWAQEEPKNAGPWTYVQPRLRNIQSFLNKQNSKVFYAGRPIMGATAVGFTSTHNAQLDALLTAALK